MCWKCRNTVTVPGTPSRGDECPVCHKDLRSCRNCLFYAPGSHFDCHETVDEPVADKERANFCGHFKLKREWGGAAQEASQSAAARRAFDALFG